MQARRRTEPGDAGNDSAMPNSSPSCIFCDEPADLCLFRDGDYPRPICRPCAYLCQHFGTPVKFRPVEEMEAIATAVAVADFLMAGDAA